MSESCKTNFSSVSHLSTLDSRPKSSSPIRLPEISGGQTNRAVDAEPQPSKITSGEVLVCVIVAWRGKHIK